MTYKQGQIMKFRFILILSWLALVLGGCSLADDITPPPGYQSPTPVPTMGPLFPANPPDLATGAAIYTEKCAPCHGAQGLGDGPSASKLPKAPSALGKPEIAGAAVPADWYTVVTQGRIEAFMPPFESLNDQERWDVVAYALSLSTTPEQLAQGQAVYEANCVDCHGADGKKSEKSDFTDQALMSRLSHNDLLHFINVGFDAAMPGYGLSPGTKSGDNPSQLSEVERSAVAAYLRTFTFATAGVSTSTPEPATVAEESPTPATGPGTTATPASTETVVISATPSEALGTISGQITNGSADSLPAGLKAVLHTFEHDATTGQFNEVATLENPLSSEGTYTFSDLPIPASYAFYVSIDYAGTSYSSEPLVPTEGQSAYDLPITIYETTTDTSGLVADRVHVLLDYSKQDVIQVVEYYVISNPGTKAVVAQNDGGPIVTIPLPNGYTNLQPQDGQIGNRYLQTADGFADTTPVVPGKQQYQLIFAFDLPYNTSFEFNQPFALNVSAVTLLVSEGVKVEGQNLVDSGMRDMGNGGGEFQVYDTGSRQVGESLAVTVSGGARQAPLVSIPVDGSTRNLVIGIGTLGFALILAAFWLYTRERSRSLDNEILDEEDIDSGSTDEILDAIIALDDQYSAGNIPEEAYKQRRAEMKEQLKGKL
jgi:mono/diheme cytochrome c family protein